MQNPDQENLPTAPVRIKSFVNFFRGYMGVSSFVVASLPIPITLLDAVPMYYDFRVILSIYTSLFCFLILAFIFYMRHAIAAHAFFWREHDNVAAEISYESPFIRMLPFYLMAASFCAIISYHVVLDSSIISIAERTATLKEEKPSYVNSCGGLLVLDIEDVCNVPSRESILRASYLKVPFGKFLIILYIGSFALAEAAFVLMATREYLQELLGINDVEIIEHTLSKMIKLPD